MCRSLGVLMYELICGHTPFGHHKSEKDKLRAIQQGHYHLPSHVSEHAKSLISKLLTTNPAKRLGNLKRKEKDITSHPWFQGFDWDAHASQKMPVSEGRTPSRTALFVFPSPTGATPTSSPDPGSYGREKVNPFLRVRGAPCPCRSWGISCEMM